MARRILTEEEKAGKKIADVISDFRLDATIVGDSLGTSQPVDVLNRLVEMVNGIYVSRERFRRALGEAPSEVEVLEPVDAEVEESTVETEDGFATPFVTRCEILGNFWVANKGDEKFTDFIEYNDLGLPLAYSVSINAADSNDKTSTFVNETWDLFLAQFGLEDEGFESLDEIIEPDFVEDDEV